MTDLVSVRDSARFDGPPSRFRRELERSTLVERTRLDERFAAATGRVIRLLAPGGYGKSLLMARWVANDQRKTRWVDLEPFDNDPVVLAHTLGQALVDLGTSVSGPSDIAHMVAHCSEPFILVLDDIHHLQSSQSSAVVNQIIENLPGASTLVLAGRANHHADIARFRLMPGVIDLAADDLAFDLGETEELLSSMGVEWKIDELTELSGQFEGWPAGLRLAVMAVTGAGRGSDVPVPRLGEIEFVGDYITEEWFARLDPEDQQLLMSLGCLGRFSGDLCDASLGRTDSAATLRRLCRDELVVFALDQQGSWYRFHPLLERWLSTRLRNQNPTRWAEIHFAAGTWWEDKGDIDLAIAHATAAEDLDRTEALIAAYAPAHVARGMHRTVQRWLDSVDNDRIRESPALCVIASLVAVDVGDSRAARSWSRAAWQELQRTDGGHGRVSDRTRLQVETLHATYEFQPAAELLPIAVHARGNLPPGPEHALATMVLGVNQYLCGDPAAEDTLRQALFENHVGQWTIMHAHSAALLAIVLDFDGHRDEVEELSNRALDGLDSRPGETFPATALTMAIASLVAARSGHRDRAAHHLGVSLAKIDQYEYVAPWIQILGLATLVRTTLLLDDAQHARRLQQRLERLMEIQDRTTPLAAHVEDLRGKVEGAVELLAERTWSLTPAELRVARYLPTNLSLGDIAERLYLSRNTVKSHAAAIYRKLGTRSRGDAVDRARQAGLLGEDTGHEVGSNP